MNDFIINIGPLSSFGSLQYYVAPKLSELRGKYINGESPNVIWDFSNVHYKKFKISALTAFISIAKKVSDYTGRPTKVLMIWDPNLLGLWRDVGLFEISDRFRIFEWPDKLIGGYTSGNTNESTKIIYFSDYKNAQNFDNLQDLVDYKIQLKQKIFPNLLLRTSTILKNFKSQDFVNKTANATVELIVNALVHSEDIAFVAFQVTGGGVTIAVCDAGIGFPKSLKKSYPHLVKEKLLSHNQAILVGCLIKQNSMGLRFVIDDILNTKTMKYEDVRKNYGWVNISSYNTEFRWQRELWTIAKERINGNSEEVEYSTINTKEIIGEPKKFLDPEDYLIGYWRMFEDRLVGTRISFEIKR